MEPMPAPASQRPVASGCCDARAYTRPPQGHCQGVDEVQVGDDVEARESRIAQVKTAEVGARIVRALCRGRKDEADRGEGQQQCLLPHTPVGRISCGVQVEAHQPVGHAEHEQVLHQSRGSSSAYPLDTGSEGRHGKHERAGSASQA